MFRERLHDSLGDLVQIRRGKQAVKGDVVSVRGGGFTAAAHGFSSAFRLCVARAARTSPRSNRIIRPTAIRAGITPARCQLPIVCGVVLISLASCEGVSSSTGIAVEVVVVAEFEGSFT
jgi:hypothetical protein